MPGGAVSGDPEVLQRVLEGAVSATSSPRPLSSAARCWRSQVRARRHKTVARKLQCSVCGRVSGEGCSRGWARSVPDWCSVSTGNPVPVCVAVYICSAPPSFTARLYCAQHTDCAILDGPWGLCHWRGGLSTTLSSLRRHRLHHHPIAARPPLTCPVPQQTSCLCLVSPATRSLPSHCKADGLWVSSA